MDDKDMRNEVHFKIGSEGVEFNAKGDSDFIERERNAFEAKLLPLGVDAVTRTRGVSAPVQYIETVEKPLTFLPNGADVGSDGTPMIPIKQDLLRISLASFIKSKGADSNYDFILCAVWFNCEKNNITAFSSITLRDLYADAKRPVPKNLSMSLNQLVQKGLIMENKGIKGLNPKEYVLTSDGERVVAEMQPKEGKEKKTNGKSRKTRTKLRSAYSGINCDELNLDKYPSVKGLTTFKEKMMMVLYIVTKEGKGEWFTSSDVLCILTDIFGEAASDEQVKGVFRREKMWFKAENVDGSKKEIKRKLLNQGVDFAKSLCEK